MPGLDPSPHRCPRCRAAVPADAVNEQHRAAVCRSCGTPFALPRRAPRPRQAIPLPKGITIESGEPPPPPEGGYRASAKEALPELVVRRRWFRLLALFWTFFALMWNGFLVVCFGLALTGPSPSFSFLCFPLIHVGAGVGVAYYTAALWVNSTVLRVADGRLTVRHGPLPWWGERDLAVRSITQLFHRRRVRRTKNGQTVTWEVHAWTDDHQDVKLLVGLPGVQQARYIEWVVEQHLGIEDDPSQNRR